jgi:decaprenylphospho-beta-D-erythro-pentofuranosid-2-ulose 2-reductase
VYGGAKAGLDGFCQGLGDALSGSGVELMIVRPGFVRTKMTAARTPAPFAASAEQVAASVVRGLEQGAEIVWVPKVLAVVFAGLRCLPRRVWRVLPE